MSDSDDDLLALAGAGEEEEEEPKPVTGGKNNKSKRSRNEDDGENGDEDGDDADDEDIFVSPYPLDGKYKDSKDKQYIDSLPEIEREQILFERGEEMEKFRQRGELARRVKERRLAEKALEKKSSKQRAAKSGESGKKSQLSELKKRRQEKETRSQRRAEGIEEEDDDEEEKGSDYYDEEEEESGSDRGSVYGDEEDDERVEWADSKSKDSKRSIQLNDLNKIKFGKTLLAKYCHYPGFEHAIVGAYVRINIGYDHETQSNIYRVCLVKGLQQTNKPYSFLNRTVDSNLLVAHGRSERAFEMGICSDQSITEKEFERWKRVLEEQDLSLPSVKKLDRKYKDLVELQNHQLTSDEVNEMIQKRQKFSENSLGANAVIEKSMLQQQRVIAMEKGDFKEVESIDERLDNIERSIQRNQRQADTGMDKLAKVNERNRRSNVERVRKAEIKANENRRKAAMGQDVASDPFSRLRTSAKTFYESNRTPKERAAAQKAAEEEEEARRSAANEQEEAQSHARKSMMAKKKLSRVDDLIANLDIELEIEV